MCSRVLGAPLKPAATVAESLRGAHPVAVVCDREAERMCSRAHVISMGLCICMQEAAVEARLGDEHGDEGTATRLRRDHEVSAVTLCDSLSICEFVWKRARAVTRMRMTMTWTKSVRRSGCEADPRASIL